jgi:thioredoxin-like negative regulator of GroEL
VEVITMSESLISDVSATDFEQAVIERSRTTPVLVDFWAHRGFPGNAPRSLRKK